MELQFLVFFFVSFIFATEEEEEKEAKGNGKPQQHNNALELVFQP